MIAVSDSARDAHWAEMKDACLVVTVLLENVKYGLDFVQVVDPST